MVDYLAELGKRDEAVLGKGADALLAAVVNPAYHHRAAYKLFAGIFLIVGKTEAVDFFSVYVNDYLVFGNRKGAVHLFGLAVKIKGQRIDILRKLMPFRR